MCKNVTEDCPEAVKKAKLRKYFGSKNRKSCVKNGTAEVVELPLPSCQLYPTSEVQNHNSSLNPAGVNL